MYNKLFKFMLLFFVFFQGVNLVLIVGNLFATSNYQVNVWQYLFAVGASFLFAILLLANILNNNELLELIFDIKNIKAEK